MTTSLEDIGVVVLDIACVKCGLFTMVAALGWDAMPVVDAYVGPCCRRYIGDLEWRDE